MSKKWLKKQKNTVNRSITLTKPNSYAAEEFKTLRTNIQFTMVDKSYKTIAFTSSLPGEGKTTVVANTAIAFANKQNRILLVDADMRNPRLHRFFNLSNHTGLSTLLKDHDASLKRLMHSTLDGNLCVLTSGVLPPNPAELIDSQRMTDLVEEFKDEFDMVLFDMPPVLSVTDAQIMATKTDGTVFVIRNGAAEEQQLFQAKNLLEQVEANVIGAVFNDKERAKQSNYGYYSRTSEE